MRDQSETEDMMTNDELDEKVLETITSKAARTAGRIQAKLDLGPTAMRDVDRSLQRLRKRRSIEYVSPVQGWRPVVK